MNVFVNAPFGPSQARVGVLTAGWPIETPGVVLNRFCGSGQQAVTWAVA
jgi:acetyl-CoA C-acetyltransferase